MRRLRETVSSRLGAAAVQSNSESAGTGGAQQAASGALALAGHVVVVFFLIYFLLASADHIKQRLIEVAGRDAEGRRKATKVIQDINTHIQRYLLVLLVTAIIVGVATSVALAAMGVRHALLWGALAGVFNSIPYFGPVIVSGGLFAVGMTQGDVQQGLRMAGVAIAITSLEGWLLTPLLMGKAERMSALAVFLGLLLWTWLWDAWGTILAVPMLVVLKAVADQVDLLKPVGRLLAPEKKREGGRQD
jgi:predicted PurR-regulated permease PerM